MFKKTVTAAMLSAVMVIGAPMANAAQLQEESVTVLARGPEQRMGNFDSFWKCMAHRSLWSQFGHGVSYFCHKDGNQWYYNWWNL